ncbi:MAG TPA: hypothetical protein PKJ98_16670 [Verrucomicrobiota bacterium]|nr:hypothetical protein [Verrucomicrobiota bacterium]
MIASPTTQAPAVRLDYERRLILLPAAAGHYSYEIALSDLATPEQVLAWVYFLCDKSWFSTEVMRDFIGAASRVHGFSLTI